MRRLHVGATLLVVAGALTSASASAQEPPDVVVSVDRAQAAGLTSLALGATHAQYSLDPWGDPIAVELGKNLLASATTYQNQHIYGWGATNPEPSPDVYDWRTLDRRINLMRSMGATPVITLCCAPDWMTKLGTETSTYPNKPPTPEHYGDFAELVREIALRYPDVKHYVVWNQMKGFWGPSMGYWDHVAYTDLYNVVYDTLKAVDPGNQVGGLYMGIEGSGDPITGRQMKVIEHWLANKHGADFISLDHSIVNFSSSDVPTQAEILSRTYRFARIAEQIQELTTLPIWWAEDYFDSNFPRLDYADHRFQAVALASMLLHEATSGAVVTLRWQPQGKAFSPYDGNQQSFFSDTRITGGGQPFPTYDVYKLFHDVFPPGTTLFAAASSSADVEVLASATTTLLVNKNASPLNVSLDGAMVQLAGYEVRAVPVTTG